VTDPSTTKPIRVLVAETVETGSPPVLLKTIAEMNGGQFEPIQVRTVREVLEKLEGNPFDAIVLDLSLPDSAGLDSYRMVAARVPDVPVLVVDWTDNRSLALDVLREGAQDYLVKSEIDGQLLRRSLLYSIERHRTRVMLQQMTFNDDLTGLLNRRGFLSLAKQQLKIAQRENWELLLLFADLDGLKKINDTFGHPEGDQALVAVAKILNETFRNSDIIARLGGDEFIVLAINAPAPGAKAITARLGENLARYNAQNRYYQLSLSYGVVQFDPRLESSLENVILKADKVLYENKRRKLQ
jgi:two-component system, cell cycle response regulator